MVGDQFAGDGDLLFRFWEVSQKTSNFGWLISQVPMDIEIAIKAQGSQFIPVNAIKMHKGILLQMTRQESCFL